MTMVLALGVTLASSASVGSMFAAGANMTKAGNMTAGNMTKAAGNATSNSTNPLSKALAPIINPIKKALKNID